MVDFGTAFALHGDCSKVKISLECACGGSYLSSVAVSGHLQTGHSKSVSTSCACTVCRRTRMTDTLPRSSQAISALRAAASHAPYDAGIMTASGGAHISDGDANAIAVGRSPAQVRQPAFPRRVLLFVFPQR